MKPPMYDEKLTKNTIRSLYLAPVLFFALGAVAFSNQQVFYNDAPKIDPDNIFPLYGHKYIYFFTKLNPGTIMFIYFVGSFFGVFLQSYIRKYKSIICGCFVKNEDDEEEE
jgi:hypothetical protein